MAYKTYTTEALVCGSKDSNTSDRAYLLFTEEAGMLWATARSVREEKSKQRYALQDFSRLRVSLVKGKSGWRIGSVESIGNPFLGAASRAERAYVNRIVSLLRRYIHGEQPLPEVFADVTSALSSTAIHSASAETQLVFTVRLLHTLGYISKSTSTRAIIDATDLKRALAAYEAAALPELERVIAQAHESSQL